MTFTSSMSDFSDRKHPKTLVLFDVDGTLTPARQTITPEIKDMLTKLRKECAVGFVGGSDLAKQKEQLGNDVKDVFDYCFSENGLEAYKFGKAIKTQSFIEWIGEAKYNEFIKFVLRYLSELDLPVVRGTFVEFRKGLVNISPVGRNASIQERNDFEKYDNEHHIRADMVTALKARFPDLSLTYSIGGQISFDVFPTGWDKTYCLRHVEKEGFDTIHFFGDKTQLGGNDYEIYHDKRVTGHAVKSPADTLKIINDLFFK